MDSGGNENIGVYVEAKSEYTRQFTQFLIPALLDFFLNNLFQNAQDSKETADSKKLLWNFQNALKDIPEWNIDKVKRETETIITMTRCDYLEELLTAVFIAHTKVLSAIRLTSKQKKIQITIPKLDHFIHRVLGDCARILWSNVYLFNPSGTSVERQKNINQIEIHLQEGVLQSIRNMLPVKNILKEYLHDDGDDEEETPVKKEEIEEEKKEKKEEEDKEEVIEKKEEVKDEVKEKVKEEVKEEVVEKKEEIHEEVKEVFETKEEEKGILQVLTESVSGLAPPPPSPATTPAPEEKKEETSAPAQPQMIVIDTEPTVHFSNFDTVFDPNDPEKNTISAPALKEDSDEDDDDEFVKILDSAGSLKPEEDDYEEL